MSKKVLLIAGVAACGRKRGGLSVPHFRGGAQRCGLGRRCSASAVAFGDRRRLRRALESPTRTASSRSRAPRPATTFARFDKTTRIVSRRVRGFAKSRRCGQALHQALDADRDGRISNGSAKARRERWPCATSTATAASASEMRRVRERASWQRPRQGCRRRDGKAAWSRAPRFSLERLLGRDDGSSAASTRTATASSMPRTWSRSPPSASPSPASASSERFDADGDGKVTKDEFKRFAKERFADLDVDGDGKITDADLPPMMRGRGVSEVGLSSSQEQRHSRGIGVLAHKSGSGPLPRSGPTTAGRRRACSRAWRRARARLFAASSTGICRPCLALPGAC